MARRYLIFWLLVLFFFFAIIRLFYFQIIRFQKFSDLAEGQHNQKVEIQPNRGMIFDRYMEPLAINLEALSLYCNCLLLENKEETAKTLSEMLEIDRDVLLGKFNSNKSFVWIKRKLDPVTAEKIRKRAYPGIYFLSESKRKYPNDNMACHVIGFVDIDNKGLEGIELKFNDQLKGKTGSAYLVRDARKKTVLLNEEESVPPQNGHNIVLTIDSVVQYIVEDELKKMTERYGPSSASAIVMDPFTGRILAMANYPDYDLNQFQKASQGQIKNIAVSNVYEPGSVFKVVTASAALNEGIVSLDDRIYCERGTYKSKGRVLHDYHKYGDLSFREVIAKSSNIGTVKIAQKLGAEKLYKYIEAFGFGQKTGIELPGEIGGICRHFKNWDRSDITTIPIGQGIAVTPLQLLCAISVIANGGYLICPYLVDHLLASEGGIYKEFEPVTRRRILKEETCSKMKDALKYVVEIGTGRHAKSELYDLCGKTGTAQMVDPDGGYYKNKYDATFMGFAPAEDPRISIVITAADPGPVYFGGRVAGPAFKNMAERIIQYLEMNSES
ncbi:MAG: penicillin-binding transpeptidase domain-containing protein [Candidatus Omnitrophota bacterium]